MAEKNQRNFFIAVTVTLLVLGFLYLARRVVTPFFIAFALAYLLDPLVDRMEEKKMSRTLSTLLLMLAFFLLAMGGTALLVPMFRLQAENLTQNVPDYILLVQEWLRPLLEKVAGLDQAKVQEILNEGFARFGELPLKILTFLTSLLWDSLSSLFNIIMVAANVVIIPVVMFYLLRDFDKINESLLNLVPNRFRSQTLETIKQIDRVLASFVRGQLMVALLMAVLYCIGLFIVGTPLSLFIGLVAGFANLVPYLGLALGFVPALVLTYLQTNEWLPLLGVAGVFAVVQALEGMVITPRVVGENIGLHPVAVILAVLLGGEFFGLMGIILGVPAVAVLNVLFARGLKKYKQSSLYSK